MKERPHEDRGRDQSDVSISQGAPRIACYHQEPGEKHETDSPSQPLEGGFQVLKKKQPDNTLISDFCLPERKINFYCFKPPSDGSHRKPIQQLKPFLAQGHTGGKYRACVPHYSVILPPQPKRSMGPERFPSHHTWLSLCL